MKALVTGGAGFVGSHLVDVLLSEGYEVIVVDDLSSGFRKNIDSRVKFIRGDVKDRNLIERCSRKCDAIFDYAAFHPNIVGHIMKQASQDPARDAAETLSGIINVLEAARKSGSKVVFASTAAVYGEPKRNPVSEKAEVKPTSPYGVSKYCGEHYCRFYHEQYGVKTYIGRIFNSYGPRMYKYLLFDAMHKLAQNHNQLKLLGTGEEVRDYIFVGDTANAFYAISQSDYEAEPVNIGTGIGTSVKEMIRTLCDAMGIDPEVKFGGESWKGNTNAIYADVKCLKKTGWKPRYGLKEGVRLFVEWFNVQRELQVTPALKRK
jgi:UDP-glucose 4-epimerase